MNDSGFAHSRAVEVLAEARDVPITAMHIINQESNVTSRYVFMAVWADQLEEANKEQNG